LNSFDISAGIIDIDDGNIHDRSLIATVISGAAGGAGGARWLVAWFWFSALFSDNISSVCRCIHGISVVISPPFVLA